MTIEQTVHNAALVLQTKVDLLAWIGIMPEPYATFHGLEVREMRKALVDEATPPDILDLITKEIPKMDATMDEGLYLIMKKLKTDDCIECAKCDDLRDVIQMFMTKEPIDQIRKKIEKHYGDITDHPGSGMPGHQPNMSVRAVTGGRIIDLIKSLMGSDSEAIGFKTVADQNGMIKNFIGLDDEPPDKDKLH